MIIRSYQDKDLFVIKEITALCFDGVCIDQNIENLVGEIDNKSWQWRKVRHIDADVATNASGVFVAEVDKRVVGYITTRIDPESKVGGIPNIAVLPAAQGEGIGRALMERAILYFQEVGMHYTRIETLDQNDIGSDFYPNMGFKEVARQIHYVMSIPDPDGDGKG